MSHCINLSLNIDIDISVNNVAGKISMNININVDVSMYNVIAKKNQQISMRLVQCTCVAMEKQNKFMASNAKNKQKS